MKFLALISCLVMWSIAAARQSSNSYNLRECLIYADKNSPLKKHLGISRQQSEAEIKLAKSEFLPQINAYSDYRQYFDNPTYLFPTETGQVLSSGTSDGPYPIRLGQKFNLFAGANISQVLFDKRWLRASEYDRLTDELLVLSEEAINEEVILGISSTFYEIQKLKSKAVLARQTHKRLNRLKDILQIQTDNGVLKKTEVERLNLKISKLEIDEERILVTIDLLFNRLKYLLSFGEGYLLRPGGCAPTAARRPRTPGP